jgi:outer membrane autotransporter protein
LQSLFDSGANFDTGFNALYNLSGNTAYAAALGSLTGRALGSIAAYRYQASRRFVSDVNGACDTQDDTTCTWARVQAGHTTQDETANALGYDAVFQVYEMGAQTRIADGLYLGGALGYEHSKLRDEDNTSRMHGSSMLGAIGLRYQSGRFALVGSVDGGYGWYTSNRQITVGSETAIANARPRLWNIGVDLTASYLVSLGGSSTFKPFAEVRGSNVHSNAFAEQSTSEFALDVLSQSDFAVSGTVGAAFGTSFGIGNGMTLKPFVSAAVEFAGDTDWKTSARFVGESGTVDPFTTQTRSPGTFGRFGIGADLASGPGFDLTLSYNPEVGSHYVTQQGVARLTYRF